MGIMDFINEAAASPFFASPSERAQYLQNKQAEQQLKQWQAEQAARAKLVAAWQAQQQGGNPPLMGGITAPQGSQQAPPSLMGPPPQQMGGLMGPPPDPALLAQAFPDQVTAQIGQQYFPAPPMKLAKDEIVVGPPGPDGKPAVIASNRQPDAPKFESIFVNGREIKAFVQPDGSYKPVGGAKAESDANEPLVLVPDPNDPTKGIYTPRSQAIGKPGYNTPRERNPKMKTYYREDGSVVQLDANDPADQAVIKEQNLTDNAPNDSERTAKGFLDRMTAAEAEMNRIMAENPGFNPANLKDAAAAKVLPGSVGQSTPYQQYWQKAADYYRAKLRKESGAVIGDNEMKDEIKSLFPILGDSDEVKQGKAGSRQLAIKQLATSAGIFGRPYLRGQPTPSMAPAAAPAPTPGITPVRPPLSSFGGPK